MERGSCVSLGINFKQKSILFKISKISSSNSIQKNINFYPLNAPALPTPLPPKFSHFQTPPSPDNVSLSRIPSFQNAKNPSTPFLSIPPGPLPPFPTSHIKPPILHPHTISQHTVRDVQNKGYNFASLREFEEVFRIYLCSGDGKGLKRGIGRCGVAMERGGFRKGE